MPSYDLTGNKVSKTYARLVQYVSGSYYDGFGNPITVSGSIESASFSISSSYSVTSSYALNGGNGLATGSTYPITSSWSVTALTASYFSGSITNSISSSYTATASYASNGFNSIQYQVTTSGSILTVYQALTSSYNNMWFDYGVNDGVSNARCGTLYGCWFNGLNKYAEHTTTDIGNTADIILSMDVSGSYVRVLALTNTTNNWNIKALIRYL
jgi:hypothetical protein